VQSLHDAGDLLFEVLAPRGDESSQAESFALICRECGAAVEVWVVDHLESAEVGAHDLCAAVRKRLGLSVVGVVAGGEGGAAE
jgi:predicted nucleic acid-binding Zn ribbon protein